MTKQTSHSETPSTFPWLRLAFLVGLVAIVAALRLLPHPLNFTPIGAIALFSGATFGSKRTAALVPLATLLVSDILIGFHSLTLVVYGCFLFNVCLGWWLRDRIRPLPIAGATLLGAIVFFVVTNFACWLAFYEPSFAGLTRCYFMAIPFFGNTLLGDAVYATALFGSLAFAQWQIPALRPLPRPATA